MGLIFRLLHVGLIFAGNLVVDACVRDHSLGVRGLLFVMR